MQREIFPMAMEEQTVLNRFFSLSLLTLLLAFGAPLKGIEEATHEEVMAAEMDAFLDEFSVDGYRYGRETACMTASFGMIAIVAGLAVVFIVDQAATTHSHSHGHSH